MAIDNSEIIFGCLPLEIWHVILDFLRWESWTTLLSLNISCRDFHQIVLPVLFKTVRIQFPMREGNIVNPLPRLRREDLPSPGKPFPKEKLPSPADIVLRQRKEIFKHDKLLGLLEKDSGKKICPHVRVLVLSRGETYNQSVHLDLIRTLVENMKNLEIIRWRGMSFPPSLLQNLNSRQPSPYLYCEGSWHTFTGDGAREGIPYIRSLSITCNSNLKSHDINSLGKVIMSLPNLNRLILKYFTRERGGTMPIFGLTPGSMLPSLRTLALTNFRFGPKEAAGWAQYLRNQHLRRLSLDGNIEMLDFIDCLSGYVPALESLTIRISNGTDPDTKSRTTRLLDAFLSHIDGLTAFTAYDLPKEVLYSAARYQRSHLRQLRFRETGYPELRWSGDQGKDCPFSPEELKTLSSELPRIEQLGIDLRFKGKTHYDILNALASFPNLKHLELNTPYRTDWSFWGHQSIAIAEQWLNESITEDAFNYVASQKKHHEKTSGDSTSTTPCPKLKALDIKGGEWEPFMKDYKAKLLKGLCVYACRRGDAVPGKLYTVRLPCKSQGSVSMVEDSMYEEALHSAGLLDPRKADFGPPIW